MALDLLDSGDREAVMAAAHGQGPLPDLYAARRGLEAIRMLAAQSQGVRQMQGLAEEPLFNQIRDIAANALGERPRGLAELVADMVRSAQAAATAPERKPHSAKAPRSRSESPGQSRSKSG
jgi:hypothetical protein